CFCSSVKFFLISSLFTLFLRRMLSTRTSTTLLGTNFGLEELLIFSTSFSQTLFHTMLISIPLTMYLSIGNFFTGHPYNRKNVRLNIGRFVTVAMLPL